MTKINRVVLMLTAVLVWSGCVQSRNFDNPNDRGSGEGHPLAALPDLPKQKVSATFFVNEGLLNLSNLGVNVEVLDQSTGALIYSDDNYIPLNDRHGNLQLEGFAAGSYLIRFKTTYGLAQTFEVKVENGEVNLGTIITPNVDLAGNNVVDEAAQLVFLNHYGQSVAEPESNSIQSAADINGDGEIALEDLVLFYNRYDATGTPSLKELARLSSLETRVNSPIIRRVPVQ